MMDAYRGFTEFCMAAAIGAGTLLFLGLALAIAGLGLWLIHDFYRNVIKG